MVYPEDLIKRCTEKYKRDFTSLFITNATSARLLGKSLGLSDEYNKIYMLSALFTILGVIIDNIFDEGNVNEIIQTHNKFSWQNIQCVLNGEHIKSDTLWEKVLYEFGQGYNEISEFCNKLAVENTLNFIKSSWRGEVYSAGLDYAEINRTLDIDTYISKSVDFVAACYGMVLMTSKFSMNDEYWKAIYDLGFAIMLLDDINDFYDDIQEYRPNYILARSGCLLLDRRGIIDAIDNIIDSNLIQNLISELKTKMDTGLLVIGGEYTSWFLYLAYQWNKRTIQEIML